MNLTFSNAMTGRGAAYYMSQTSVRSAFANATSKAGSCPANMTKAGPKTAEHPQKPVWNPRKVYEYVEDMGKGFQDYKAKAQGFYAVDFAARGTDTALSVDELKSQIKEYFPEYTLTNHEPRVANGIYYLYIDETQLKKLAADPGYRAKVFGLMDSELQGKNGYTLRYSDGRCITQHLTGTVFSLSEKNDSYGGIPYRGSCTTDHPFSSSASCPQFRSNPLSLLPSGSDRGKKNARSQSRKRASESAIEKLEAEKIRRLHERRSEQIRGRSLS